MTSKIGLLLHSINPKNSALHLSTQNRINTTDAVLTEKQAIQFASLHLGVGDSGALSIEDVANEASTYLESSLSRVAIPIKAVYAETENGDLRLAWDTSLEIPSGDHYWSVRIDAVTGDLIDKIDWMVSCQAASHNSCSHAHSKSTYSEEMLAAPAPPPSTDAYNVFAIPVESPNHGPRVLVTGPSDPVASTFATLLTEDLH